MRSQPSQRSQLSQRTQLPQRMMDDPAPRYRLAPAVLVDLAGAWLFGRRRDFSSHARKLVGGIQPPLCVLGSENIPLSGPGVILVNHYSSLSFWAVWLAIGISAVVPVEIHWTITAAFTYPGQPLSRVRRIFSQVLLGRLARVYGFNPMPPMPPIPGEEVQRAASVRRLIGFAREHPQALLGLAPEGSDQPGGTLALPPPGAGRLAYHLDRLGFPFFPVGAFEERGIYCLRFGKPFCLELPAYASRADLDLGARQRITQALAECLPARLRCD